jgi:hypothetical protein
MIHVLYPSTNKSAFDHLFRVKYFNTVGETASGGLFHIDRDADGSSNPLLKGHRELIISSLGGALIIHGPEQPGNPATQCIYE